MPFEGPGKFCRRLLGEFTALGKRLRFNKTLACKLGFKSRASTRRKGESRQNSFIHANFDRVKCISRKRSFRRKGGAAPEHNSNGNREYCWHGGEIGLVGRRQKTRRPTRKTTNKI